MNFGGNGCKGQQGQESEICDQSGVKSGFRSRSIAFDQRKNEEDRGDCDTDGDQAPCRSRVEPVVDRPDGHHSEGGAGGADRGARYAFPAEPTGAGGQHDQHGAEGQWVRREACGSREMETECEGNRHAPGPGRPPEHPSVAIAVSDEKKGQSEDPQDDETESGTLGIHRTEDPEALMERRPREAEDRQEGPTTGSGKPQETEVQQQDVAEQGGRTGGIGRDQQRCREPSEQPENGDEDRVPGDGDRYTHCGNGDHQYRRGSEPDQVVEILCGPCRAVQNDDAGPRQSVGGGCLVTLDQPLRTNHAAETDRDAEDHPHRR